MNLEPYFFDDDILLGHNKILYLTTPHVDDRKSFFESKFRNYVATVSVWQPNYFINEPAKKSKWGKTERNKLSIPSKPIGKASSLLLKLIGAI